MKTTRGLLLAALVVGMFTFSTCGNRKEAAPGSTTECDGGQLDPATNLCWQNPPPDDKLNWEAAKAYCDGLSLGGHDDWRLPKIHELNSIVRGCVNGTASGDLRKSKCGVADPGCLGALCNSAQTECWACKAGRGPAPGGCYWVPTLSGNCSYYWSSSAVVDRGIIDVAWYVRFDLGVVDGGPNRATSNVRCVRAE